MRSVDYADAERFIAAIPVGRWTSYKDVATAAGNPDAYMAIGYWLRESGGSIQNYWRVLRADGHVADGFISHASGRPHDAVAAKDLLRSEGIRFHPSGCASQAQHFRYNDWNHAHVVLDQAPALPAAAETGAVARDRRIVADVSARRIAKGKPPLTPEQETTCLDDWRRSALKAAQRANPASAPTCAAA